MFSMWLLSASFLLLVLVTASLAAWRGGDTKKAKRAQYLTASYTPPYYNTNSNVNDNGSGISSDILCFYNTATPQASETCYNITHNELLRLNGAGVPSILGIGPAKTSSSVLASALGKHPDIELGDAKRGGRECCFYELYVLCPNSIDFLKGPKAYEKYFKMRPGATYVEKTPKYADDRVAPYRALAMLGQKDLRLVYTFREPVEALYSLYKHRAYKNISFNTYAEMMMLSQAHLDECRRRIVPSTQSIASLSLQSRVFVEQMVEQKCTPELKMGDALTQFDHAGNLQHWRSVFPSAAIVCVNFTVWHRTGPGEADAVVQTLYKYLGLPASPAAVKTAVKFLNDQKYLVHSQPGSSLPGSPSVRERLALYYANSNSFASFCDKIIA